MTFDDFIINTGYFFLILNTLVFTLSYTKKDKALKYFIMYLVLCSFVQLISSNYSSKGEDNLFLSHYFFIGQFIFLSLFFSTLYSIKKLKKIIRFLIFPIALYFVIYLKVNPDEYKKWNVLEIAITSIPLLTYSFYFFIKKIDDNKSKKYIYFNSGFFVYTLCSTLIFTLGNIGIGTPETKDLKLIVWDINAFLYLIFQIFIFVEWYKNFRKPIFLKKR
jgi:cell division protein FtsW (lipid II flippase)